MRRFLTTVVMVVMVLGISHTDGLSYNRDTLAVTKIGVKGIDFTVSTVKITNDNDDSEWVYSFKSTSPLTKIDKRVKAIEVGERRENSINLGVLIGHSLMANMPDVVYYTKEMDAWYYKEHHNSEGMIEDIELNISNRVVLSPAHAQSDRFGGFSVELSDEDIESVAEALYQVITDNRRLKNMIRCCKGSFGADLILNHNSFFNNKLAIHIDEINDESLRSEAQSVEKTRAKGREYDIYKIKRYDGTYLNIMNLIDVENKKIMKTYEGQYIDDYILDTFNKNMGKSFGDKLTITFDVAYNNHSEIRKVSVTIDGGEKEIDSEIVDAIGETINSIFSSNNKLINTFDIPMIMSREIDSFNFNIPSDRVVITL